MEPPPPNVSESEDLRHLTQPNKRSKTLINGGESSDPIPSDLIVEIFLRLPTKSTAKCRCVSKRWASILRLPVFTDLFLTRSLAQPKLLFVCHKDGHVFFFSSPQPQILEENSSLSTTICYGMKIPSELQDEISAFDIRVSSIKGLVFLRIEGVLKRKGHVLVILNPSTGQSFTLPKVKSRRKIGVRSYFGYDPVQNQYKVLSMTWLFHGSRWLVSEEHQVLTLGGTGEPSWRKIECLRPYGPPHGYYHICINGVLYYPAVHNSSKDLIIVCFDVRSENFRFVKSRHSFASPLINYDNKLASIQCYQTYFLNEHLITIKLWVLEDAEKQEWSEQTYVLPAWCNSFVGDSGLRVVGVTQTTEIVLSSSRQSWFYYVFYYNIERNTVAMVDIRGMEAFKHYEVYTYLDHVEDVTLMQVFN